MANVDLKLFIGALEFFLLLLIQKEALYVISRRTKSIYINDRAEIEI